MKDKVNSYLAILFITLVGSGATLIIVHIGTTNILAATVAGNEAQYISLQQSILNSRASAERN